MKCLNNRFNHFQLEPVPRQILSYSRNHSVASTMIMYYLLQACKQKDAVALARLLPIISQGDADFVYQDIILHLLVSNLVNMDDSFAYPFFYGPVIDEYFVVSLNLILEHSYNLLRLLISCIFILFYREIYWSCISIKRKQFVLMNIKSLFDITLFISVQIKCNSCYWLSPFRLSLKNIIINIEK